MSTENQDKKSHSSKQRDKALQRYYNNPNRCLQCDNIIRVPDGVKVSAVRKKKFCNQSCSAKHSNHNRTVTKMCKCGNLILKREKECETCKQKRRIHTKTKNDLFAENKSWQTVGSAIRKDANFVFEKHGRPRVCTACGYNIHTEICHIRPVSDFPNDALIDDINAPDNLVALCPNCHWEFDNDPEASTVKSKLQKLAAASRNLASKKRKQN